MAMVLVMPRLMSRIFNPSKMLYNLAQWCGVGYTRRQPYSNNIKLMSLYCTVFSELFQIYEKKLSHISIYDLGPESESLSRIESRSGFAIFPFFETALF